MAFDIDGARKAGYSDDEIANYLSQENKFDYEGAKKAGYSPAEIISHLSGTNIAPAQPKVSDAVGAAAQAVLPSNQSNEPLQPSAPQDLMGALKSGAQGALQALQAPSRMMATEQALHPAIGGEVENATGSKLAGLAAEIGTNPLTYMAAAAPEEQVAKDAVAKPGFLQKVFNLFKKPSTDEDIEQSVGQVQGLVKNATDKYGKMLNDAKAKAGLPVSLTEKEKSLEQFGNVFGLDVTQFKPEVQKLMEPASNPAELAKNISQFKKYVVEDPEMAAKVGSYLQDQVNRFVDWNKGGDQIDGLLKNQYKDLGNIIEESSKPLQEAKAKMATVLDNVNFISKKMEDPGQATAFLKRIYNNPTGRNKDYLDTLRNLEGLTGKETVNDLFKLFGNQEKLDVDLSHPLKTLQPLLENSGELGRNTPRLAGPASALFNPALRTPEMQSLRDRLRNKKNAK